ncbi:NSP5 [Rotavirus G chicken/03V0567/DEU/2003]|uniref:NSP5 n=1 Tax=Rotavirus G chicken/03V0567/DEU/2003 TaxID=994995 RepID=M4H2A1_9REOV|nr:NSP5 [Rotavirus G chicken/03V0567/DEU/2003]AFL91902.1 NSP5 [Rotavirus G chicken/03V0567/DEU/2003]
MAEVSEFDFKIKKDKKKQEKTKSKKMVVKDNETVVTHEEKSERGSVYSEESSSHSSSNYAEAYERLQRELNASESNDNKCKRTIRNWADEVEKQESESENEYDVPDTEFIPKKTNIIDMGSEAKEQIMNEISKIRMEMDVIKEAMKPQGVDAAFNLILKNVDNLSTKQKHALVNAIVMSMK